MRTTSLWGFSIEQTPSGFWAELRELFTKFNLELHPEKTRLFEFGPYAAENRQRAGQGKPETFNFLEVLSSLLPPLFCGPPDDGATRIVAPLRVGGVTNAVPLARPVRDLEARSELSTHRSLANPLLRRRPAACGFNSPRLRSSATSVAFSGRANRARPCLTQWWTRHSSCRHSGCGERGSSPRSTAYDARHRHSARSDLRW